jgi:hypothetical protein
MVALRLPVIAAEQIIGLSARGATAIARARHENILLPDNIGPLARVDTRPKTV